MRTIVDLPEKELQAIKALAKRERISQAEAVRRAVRHYLDTHPPQPTEEAFENRGQTLFYVKQGNCSAGPFQADTGWQAYLG